MEETETERLGSYVDSIWVAREDAVTVTSSPLNMRIGVGTDKSVIKVLRQGTRITCYGYYTQKGATVWLCVKGQEGILGYCSKKYLK